MDIKTKQPSQLEARTFHKLADLFPLTEGKEFEALVDDIRRNGLREPITRYEGAILDGRNRFRACERADVIPNFRDYDGDDPFGFVVWLCRLGKRASPASHGVPTCDGREACGNYNLG
jgi:hypothetical protein